MGLQCTTVVADKDNLRLLCFVHRTKLPLTRLATQLKDRFGQRGKSLLVGL
jgi:hypothetical protein